MKLFLVLWIMPIVLLGSWYGLSYYDINFGYRILTRDLHDLVFTIYGNLLGIPAETIPPLVLKAVIFDTFLVVGFIVIKRRRKQIWAALRGYFTSSVKEDGHTETVSAHHQADYSRPH
ncbi:DUF6105 family protein [Hoeflea sp. YIM 152468]|uniref:DUF6105 family protein n=1 Tax=Hoeflea sp. YIM 152468 TaxID=3031759 RepID=UPI0023DABAC2|nr:DUF6105 family protein [Hoeflea sp. YIM 152468]MDF1607080.1 DUF6105 family protein [Hoeflea sp. YIM 152468]